MQFDIFDQNDHGPYPLGEQYEKRLQLIEFYDRSGFRTYHISEHHSTPLSRTPSPSVFLAAVAQRTRRLRLGPLVYVLPMHHPLRLAEEICMLDHLIPFPHQDDLTIYGNDVIDWTSFGLRSI